MKMLTCDRCGTTKYWGAKKSVPCPDCDGGVLCRVITLKPIKRVVGTLYRDKISGGYGEIAFVPDPLIWSLHEGVWDGAEDINGVSVSYLWAREEWQAIYGKLPRKGSKERVIIELVE